MKLQLLLQKRYQLPVDANRDLPKSLPGCPFSCCMIICGQTATVFSLSFLLLLTNLKWVQRFPN